MDDAARPTTVLVIGEPVGAVLLGAFLPGTGETPAAGVLADGTLAVTGILLALPRRESAH
ncbi:MAG: hypothetical protein ACT4PJ_16065 [Gemmatimonadaceae bacterium]